jgi:hypothetical protein
MPSNPDAPILAAIETIRGTVQLARALAEAGRRIDLAGLDADAAVLCTAIGLMPTAAARPLRTALETLLGDLDRLTAALAR